MKSWLVFWYSASGSLLYQISVPYDKLPVPEGLRVLPALETIHTDRSSRRLYLKLDYYHSENGDSGDEGFISGSFEKSRIYMLDIEKKNYSGYIELPRYFMETEEFNLVNEGLLGKTEEDRREDFAAGYDFRKAFDESFTIDLIGEDQPQS